MLVNDDPSQIIPKSNWKVHGLKVEWTVEETRRIEESIRITEGALTPCPSGVKIYGLGDVVKYQGRYLGTYKLTPKMWNGHPVYKSNDGKGALRIPLVAQNYSVLLLPKVAVSLELHDSTAR